MNFSKTSTFFLCLLLAGFSYGQSADFEWVRHIAGTEGNIFVAKTLTDSQGNIYTAGNFTGDNGISNADFDPTDGVAIIDSLGSGDIYIQKLTATGAFGWARVVGGLDRDYLSSRERDSFLLDSSGNLIIAGTFEGTVDFDSDLDTTTDRLTSNGAFDLFVLKLAADGTFGWVKNFGNSNHEGGETTMVVDSQGNIIIADIFRGIVDFDPDPSSTHNLESNGSADIFVLKLASNGDFVWAKSFGGSDFDTVEHMVLDSQGNVIIGGHFEEIVDFDPDDSSTYNLESNGRSDAYVLKLASNGDFVWAKSFGGSDHDNAPNIVLDSQDNVILVERFWATVDFNPDLDTLYELSSAGNSDTYFLKLNSNGDFVWAKRIGNAESDTTPKVALDHQGNILAAGQYKGMVDFDPNPATQHELTSIGGSDAYVLKLDVNGDFVWAESYGNTNDDLVYAQGGIVLDDQGNVIVTERFRGTIDFDPDLETQFELSSNVGFQDIYVLKLASDGSFVWATSFGSSDDFSYPEIVLDPDENIILSGYFIGTVDFDPSAVADDDTFTTGTRSDGGDDQTDVYVIKYSQSTLSAITPNHPHKVVAYPNPSQGDITIDLGVNQDSVQLRVFNMFGQVVAETTHNQVSEIPLTIAGATGLYWVEVETSDGKAVFSLVKK